MYIYIHVYIYIYICDRLCENPPCSHNVKCSEMDFEKI